LPAQSLSVQQEALQKIAKTVKFAIFAYSRIGFNIETPALRLKSF
jgi:hypothetical protein